MYKTWCYRYSCKNAKSAVRYQNSKFCLSVDFLSAKQIAKLFLGLRSAKDFLQFYFSIPSNDCKVPEMIALDVLFIIGGPKIEKKYVLY